MTTIGAKIANFGASKETPKFTRIARSTVVEGLLERQKNPNVINQGNEMMCGPSAFTFHLAQERFATYANYVMDLFDHGSAQLGSLTVTPSNNIKTHSPSSAGMAAVDWIAMASLRDSENILPYHFGASAFGVSGPSIMAHWYKKGFGASNAFEDCSWVTRKKLSSLVDVDVLFSRGRPVTLFSKGAMLGAMTEEEAQSYHSSAVASHWIPLVSEIKIDGKPARHYNDRKREVDEDKDLLNAPCTFVGHSWGEETLVRRSTWAVLALFFGAVVA